MKLYGHLISDRARKGQGGNKDLLAAITVEVAGWRTEIVTVAVVNTDKGFYSVDIKLPDGEMIHQKVSKGDYIKGKKEKDEPIYCKHGIRVPDGQIDDCK